MPSALPDGEPVPAAGALPAAAAAAWAQAAATTFGWYVHVPFCTTRCGYCDFNTYTAADLGPSVSRASYPDTLLAEVAMARAVLGAVDRPVRTVFFGGGTPTLLPSDDLTRVLAAIEAQFGLAPGAEVSVEANPDTVSASSLAQLRAGGFTRLSLGMQSAVPRVLATLDRTHHPDRVGAAVAAARAAGFEQVSLDLIYGTPGEDEHDWAVSLQSALELEPDHVSAYALVVEEGTRLAAQVRRGQIPAPDDDLLADRYLQAEETMSAAGLTWYEVSNWARDESSRCRHNLGYWSSADWWGSGPGAHSHIQGVRWWNVRHPAEYARRLASGVSPAKAREVLTADQVRDERVMLALRTVHGLPLGQVSPAAASVAGAMAADGLLEPAPLTSGTAVLTLRGRLLADTVIRDLLTA